METAEKNEVPATEQRERAWWQRLPVLLLVGAVPVAFGLYFLAVVGIGMLLTDQTREDEVRGGGTVLLVWWMYSFRQGDTNPYVSGVLLAVAAVLFAKAARLRQRSGWRAGTVIAAGTAATAVLVGVLGFVPYGVQSPKFTRDDALRRTLAERAARPWRGIRADQYLVDRGRIRFVHIPVYYVALYEAHPTVENTLDGEPCFTHREVWEVNALDGSVDRQTYDDARIGGDPCLPLRAGTRIDLRPVPA